MKPIEIPALDAEQEQLAALDDLYRATRNARLRTRASRDGTSGRRAAHDRL
jgi:hypothetical protein